MKSSLAFSVSSLCYDKEENPPDKAKNKFITPQNEKSPSFT